LLNEKGPRSSLLTMALTLYRLLFLPAFILLLPYYLMRMWRRGGYAAGLSNRFGHTRGLPAKRPGVKRVWIQAVSVGELNAIGPLLGSLSSRESIEIVLTTTTSTGLRLARERYRQLVTWIGSFPIDFWPFSRLAWHQIQPDLILLMEGELWPEHIHQGWRRRVPIVVINGRLSERSFARQKRLSSLGKGLFHKISLILAGSELDRQRFAQLNWIQPGKILNSGNLKFDFAPPPPLTPEERNTLLQSFGFAASAHEASGIEVMMGSSTWPGEETALLDSFRSLFPDFPQLRLLMVPRHAERRREIESILRGTGLPYHFRSDGPVAPAGTLVYIGDTTGELKALTRLATLVFVGKSLPPNAGGQTPMEAAALGKPLILGPNMGNFSTVTRQLLQANAARQIAGTAELLPAVRALLTDTDDRGGMAGRAASLMRAGQGATQRTVAQILSLLRQP
jgi:3-deoxy-D-manno-octulosonic-acid transferase